MNQQQQVGTNNSFPQRKRRADRYKHRLPTSFFALRIPWYFCVRQVREAEKHYLVLERVKFAKETKRAGYLEVAKKTDLLRRVLSGRGYCDTAEQKAAQYLWNDERFRNIVFDYGYRVETDEIHKLRVFTSYCNPWLANAIIESISNVELVSYREIAEDVGFNFYTTRLTGIEFVYRLKA